MLETHMKLCVTQPDFLEKFFLPQKLGKWVLNILKNWEKQGLEYIEKFCH